MSDYFYKSQTIVLIPSVFRIYRKENEGFFLYSKKKNKAYHRYGFILFCRRKGKRTFYCCKF